MKPDRWRPILRGAIAKEAFEAVAAVAADIGKVPPLARDGSLASGAAGLAVCHAYLSRARSAHDDERAALARLQEAGEAVASVTMGPSLFGGFSGVAWAMAHLHEKFISSDAGESTEAVDEALMGYVSRPGWRGDYDLITGLVGLGVYALERMPGPAARACLEGVIDRLAETAELRPDGITWHTPPELLPSHQRKDCPSGYDNLGLAHGVPGVIALLGMAHAAGIRRRVSRRLLDGAVSWLLRQKLTDSPGARFPAWLAAGWKGERCRSAWCYGDPGVAVALFSAARCVGNLDWEREALELARGAARRPPDQAGVVDAGLCHGAAGLAHVFNRMFQATGDPTLRRASRYWFQRTLAMRRPGRGVGGFMAREVDAKGRETWIDEPALFGAAGIALALLSAATSQEPEWDRMMMVSARAPATPAKRGMQGNRNPRNETSGKSGRVAKSAFIRVPDFSRR